MNMKKPPGYGGLAGVPMPGQAIRLSGPVVSMLSRSNWDFPYIQAEKPRCPCRDMRISCRWGKAQRWLFGPPNAKLPLWFKQYRWGVKIRFTTTNLFIGKGDHGLTQKDMGFYSVSVSTSERAMMEVLYEVPKKESYEEAKLLMEEMTTLRPRLVQTLLEDCASVKVKRLFMVLAETCKHAWVKKLDLSQVDFGKGKRMLVKGGRFDSKYRITVPEGRDGRVVAGERA